MDGVGYQIIHPYGGASSTSLLRPLPDRLWMRRPPRPRKMRATPTHPSPRTPHTNDRATGPGPPPQNSTTQRAARRRGCTALPQDPSHPDGHDAVCVRLVRATGDECMRYRECCRHRCTIKLSLNIRRRRHLFTRSTPTWRTCLSPRLIRHHPHSHPVHDPPLPVPAETKQAYT